MARVWGIYNPNKDGVLCIPLDFHEPSTDLKWIWENPRRFSAFNNYRLIAFQSPDEEILIEAFKNAEDLQRESPEDWYLTPIEVNVESGEILCYHHDEAVKFI